MQDASQEEKQNFLCQTILNQGYDTELFIQFLVGKKGEEGADIGNWTMYDLQQVVQEFIYLNGGGQPQPQPEPQPMPQYQQQPQAQPYMPPQQQQPVEHKSKKKSTDPLSHMAKESQKKVSMFDVIPDSKPKPQPQPQPITSTSMYANMNIPPQPQVAKPQPVQKPPQQKPKPQAQPPQPKPSAPPQQPLAPKPKELSPNTPPTAPTQTATVNAAESGERNARDLEYGIVIPEIKKCQLNEQTELGKYQIVKILVCQPEKVEGGFFSSSYYTYLVKTEPLGKQVRRKYLDFIWLQKTLSSIFTSNVIPYLPPKAKTKTDYFGESFVNKRMRVLEKFMNTLVKDPLIKNSQILYDFVNTSQDTEFNNIKKVYEKVKPFTDVQEFKSTDGQISIMVTPGKEIYVENIKDNATHNVNIFKKINYSMRALYGEMDAVVKRMTEISEQWDLLRKINERYYENNTTIESYNQMSIMFSTWANLLKEQTKLINIDIREYFKYTKNSFIAMKDFANDLENSKSSYIKGAKSLMNKKEDLFKRGDTTRWDLSSEDRKNVKSFSMNKKVALTKMCYKDTLNAISLKEFYGYYLNRVISEYERYKEIYGVLNKEYITKYCNRLTEIMGKFHMKLSETVAALDMSSEAKNDNKKIQQRIMVNINEL